ncbi:unnamed protein product [Rhizoctonia solani]|uniref:Protein kinase domain-containing protein n=1 Tax=Rhizoctonia solani TaxID=456999 RepID=A0A8H3E864_9AGAM|nr:unnamed protein product [Rhizoctonia solani]
MSIPDSQGSYYAYYSGVGDNGVPLPHGVPSFESILMPPEYISSDAITGSSRLPNGNEVLAWLKANDSGYPGTQVDWTSVVPVGKKTVFQGFESAGIHRGKLINGRLVKLVCLMAEDDLHKFKNATREIYAWSKCKHQNILGVIGLAPGPEFIAMVFPWTDYLDLRGFLRAHPQADRYALSTRIAYGVAYLHSKNIVHGCIMGSNIAMMQDHTPKITGFCEAALSNSGFLDLSRLHHTESRYSPIRWQPPELIADENDKRVEGDVYSLAMTMLEAVTGAAPYDGHWNGAAVLKITNGHHPRRPVAHIPLGNKKVDTLWVLLGECWAISPENRPTSVEVLARMTDIVSGSWIHASCQCASDSHTRRDMGTHTTPDAIINRQTSVEETLSHLYKHGCTDATHLINQTEHSDYPVSYGGYGEVYKGKLQDGSHIALKCLRQLILDSSETSQKQGRNAAHELYIWSKCNHPNVVTQHRNQIAMVSPWMENGTLGSFLSKCPQADRYTLSSQIADGVAYLHDENIVHGDIKGITDFGTATLKEYTLKFTASATTSKPGMSLRWTAPEILEETTGISFEGDVYALGMTILETITGEVPYCETVNEGALVLKIARREHPTRPETKIPLNDKKSNILWSLLTCCWSHNPQTRPSVTEVQKAMRDIALGDELDKHQL